MLVTIFNFVFLIVLKYVAIPKIEYSCLSVHPDGHQLAEMGKLLDAGKILPVIDRIFPFDQTKEALVYLKEGRAKGKVVVKVNSSIALEMVVLNILRKTKEVRTIHYYFVFLVVSESVAISKRPINVSFNHFINFICCESI